MSEYSAAQEQNSPMTQPHTNAAAGSFNTVYTQEPLLDELLADPIMELLLASDGLSRTEILPLLEDARRHKAA